MNKTNARLDARLPLAKVTRATLGGPKGVIEPVGLHTFDAALSC